MLIRMRVLVDQDHRGARTPRTGRGPRQRPAANGSRTRAGGTGA
ncbi:hypothetical protein ABZ805_14990 [Saccharopolyspora sp. NPDC047091]